MALFGAGSIGGRGNGHVAAGVGHSEGIKDAGCPTLLVTDATEVALTARYLKQRVRLWHFVIWS